MTASSRLLAVLVLVYLGITLVGLERYPAVWGDEAWIAEPAWVKAAGGPLGSPSCGELFRFADRLYWMPPLHFLALAGVYAAGIPVLLGGRLLSVLLGAVTLIILLRWARVVLAEPESSTNRSRDESNGAGTRRRAWFLVAIALAFAADPMLWKSHRTIRFEAMLALWSIVAVSAAWNPRRAWRGPLTGAACALAILTHPNGALTVIAAGGVLLLRRRSWSGAWRDAAAAAGVFAVLCLPTAIYFLQDRAVDFANVIGQNAPHVHGERSSPVWNQWGRELHRYGAYFAWPRLALPLLLWAGTVDRGDPASRPGRAGVGGRRHPCRPGLHAEQERTLSHPGRALPFRTRGMGRDADSTAACRRDGCALAGEPLRGRRRAAPAQPAVRLRRVDPSFDRGRPRSRRA